MRGKVLEILIDYGEVANIFLGENGNVAYATFTNAANSRRFVEERNEQPCAQLNRRVLKVGWLIRKKL